MSLDDAKEPLLWRQGHHMRQVQSVPPSPEPSAKRRCGWTDPNDAAVAELLLGLSHSTRSSPRDSNISEEDVIRLSPRVSHEFASKPTEALSRRRSSRIGRQSTKLAAAETDDEAEESEASLSEDSSPRVSSKQPLTVKELPVRCKCGKRVSPSHPPCKSELMLLSERFRDRFANSCGEGEECKIDLNKCALALGVPRRRLYDITIVYEAAEVVRRTGKLAYVWEGMAHLSELMAKLKVEEETGQPVGDRRGNLNCAASDQQNTHSLWTLSRKFIRLLLTSKGVVQLSDAAVHLIGDRQGTRPQTFLTVERRLYDIGSILSTLDLIKRTYIEGKRQPAFSWNWDRVDATQAAELSLRQWTQTTEHEINEQPESSMMAVKSVFASPEADAGRVDDKEVTTQGVASSVAMGSTPVQGSFQWPALMKLTGVNQQPGPLGPNLAQTALLHFLQHYSAANKALPEVCQPPSGV